MFKKLAILILALCMVAAMFALTSCDSSGDDDTASVEPTESYEEPVESEPDIEPQSTEGNVDVLSAFSADDWNIVVNPDESTLTLVATDDGIRIEQGGGSAWGRVEIRFEGGIANAASINITAESSAITGDGGSFNIMLLGADGNYTGGALIDDNVPTPFDNSLSIGVSGTVYGFLIQVFDDIRLDITGLVVETTD